MMHYLDMFSQPEVTLLADVIEVGVLVSACVCSCVHTYMCLCVHFRVVCVFILYMCSCYVCSTSQHGASPSILSQ